MTKKKTGRKVQGILFIQTFSCLLLTFFCVIPVGAYLTDSSAYPGNEKDNPVSGNVSAEGGWTDNLRFSGFVDVYGGMHLKKRERNEHEWSYRQRIRAEARYTFRTEDESAFDFIHAPAPYLVLSAQSDFLWFGKKNSYDEHDLDLYETYLNWDRGPWQFRLGKQIVRWGKTDQISPVDNVNAQDIRQFIILDLEDRKIPEWMARIRYFHNQLTLEGIFIPFHQTHEINFFDTNWAVFRHARQDILDSDLPEEFRRQIRNISVNEDKPSKKLKNSSVGTRISGTVGMVDLAASWLYTCEQTPFIQSFPVNNLNVDGPLSLDEIKNQLDRLELTTDDVEVTYERINIFGFEFETVLREYGLRGEAAFFDQQPFLQSDLTSVRKPVLHAVLGMDYASEGWYTNIQISDQIIFSYEDEILFFRRHNISLMGEISKEWARGAWEAGFQGVYFLSDQSSHFNPYITHTPVNNLDVSLGLHYFNGSRDSVLGQYRKNDQVYLNLRYYF